MTAADKRVLVPVADDSEEVETSAITDTLVRCGANVVVASVSDSTTVKMSRGLRVVADCLIGECAGKEWDAIVCPGGMPGAVHLRDSAVLTELLKAQNSKKKWIGAICASPAIVLGSHGLLPSKATCYPAQAFEELLGKSLCTDLVVVDGHVITSRGPATALPFALKVAESLFGADKAQEVAKAMLATMP